MVVSNRFALRAHPEKLGFQLGGWSDLPELGADHGDPQEGDRYAWTATTHQQAAKKRNCAEASFIFLYAKFLELIYHADSGNATSRLAVRRQVPLNASPQREIFGHASLAIMGLI